MHVAPLARLHPNGIGDPLQPVLAERLEVREVVVALLEEGVGVLAKVPGGEGRPDLIHREGYRSSQTSNDPLTACYSQMQTKLLVRVLK